MINDLHTTPECAAAVGRYFARIYPRRESFLNGLVFRRADASSRSQLAHLLESVEKLEVLDVGCGDGNLAASVLKGTPSKLRLEDLVADNVERAAHNLSGRAARLEYEVVDLTNHSDKQCYDLVLAIGVLDYYADWKSLISSLIARTRGILVFDMPRKGRLIHSMRRCWLSLYGMQLQTVSEKQLREYYPHMTIVLMLFTVRTTG